jgi:hypothetical protein
MHKAYLRFSVAIVFALVSALTAGCATGEVRGEAVAATNSSRVPGQVGLVYVIFLDQGVLKASGLSALRMGTPKYIGNEMVSGGFNGVLLQMNKLVPDSNLRVRLQSGLEKSLPPNITHTVIIAPHTVTTNGSSATSEVNIVVRDEVTHQIIWKGEAAIAAYIPENNKRAAMGIVRTLRELGLISTAA